MANDEGERKLAAILSADVVGYSRLMKDDERATVTTLKQYRAAIGRVIERHKGRVVNAPGDNILAEFPSAVEAVQCAVEIQKVLEGRNLELPTDRRMEFRIGINLGDVIEEADGTIYGDGVNIAARMESLAEAGGICISSSVFDAVEGKLEFGFDFLGEQQVKNIARPINVYRVRSQAAPAAPRTPGTRRAKLGAIAAAGVVILAVGGVVAWQLTQRTGPETAPGVASGEAPALELPDKPSIAVLAFDNMSGDAEQEYFSDGIAEDLITDLSKISELTVIARNSAFTYKGKPVKVEQIARELGVRYVLEGSVRKVGDRVRITAQFVDARTGNHLWAERYDRELKDIFAVQDEITEKIVKALKVTLSESEQKRVARKYTDNLEAYDYFLRARGFHGAAASKKQNAQAQQLLKRAIDLDPQFAAAYAELSWVYAQEYFVYWNEGSQALEQAFELAQKGMALDDSLPDAHARLGWIHLLRKEYEQAIAKGKHAIAIDPDYADGYLLLGHILIYAGRLEEGIAISKKGIPLDPHLLYHYLLHIADGNWLMGQHEEALANLKRSVALNPDWLPSYFWIAAINGELGRTDEARAAVAIILRKSPQASVEGERRKMPYKDPAVVERFVDGLRKAGLPE